MQLLPRHQQEPTTPLFNMEKVTELRWHTDQRARACQTPLWPSRFCLYTCACRISLFHKCEDANTKGLVTHTDWQLPNKKRKNPDHPGETGCRVLIWWWKTLMALLDCDPSRTLKHTYLHQTHYQHSQNASREYRTWGKSPSSLTA